MVFVYTKERIQKHTLNFLAKHFAKPIANYIPNYNQCDISPKDFSAEVCGLKTSQIRDYTSAFHSSWVTFFSMKF